MAKILCPCCFEQFDDSEVEYLCLNMSRSRPCSKAQGKEKIAASEINPKNPVCPECHQKLSTKVCPYCGFTLPYSIGTIDSYPISIIGAKESGKSNYVAVLIDELKNKVGGAFNCSLMASGDSTIARYRQQFYNPLFRNRVCVQGTDAGEVTPLIYSLLFEREVKRGFFGRKESLTKAISLTFYDAAGENFDTKQDMDTFTKYLAHSSGIILLLDPLQLPAVRQELEGKIRLPQENTDVTDLLDRTIEVIREQTGNMDMKRKIQIPIAVSFTKIDSVQGMIDDSSCLKNDSTHIQKRAFDKVDFEQVNEEMKSLVDEWMGEELINKVSANFENYGFFGLSALGSNPDMDNKIPKFRPFRVADPFLWILSQQRLIPVAK